MKHIGILFLMLACAPVRGRYDYDKEVDFTTFKTYNYASGIKTGLSELDEKRLYFQLDSLLVVNGFSKTESPDFYIDLHSKTYKTPSSNSIGIGIGGGRNVAETNACVMRFESITLEPYCNRNKYSVRS